MSDFSRTPPPTAGEEPKSKTWPDRQAPFACATRITAPTIVVGTYQTACMQIANASPSSRPIPNSASAETPSHWYVPTNPGEDGIATPRLSAAVTKTASTSESSTPTARPTSIAATAQAAHANTLIPNQRSPRSTESGSESPSSVSRRNRRGSPRCVRRDLGRRRVYDRAARIIAQTTASTKTDPTTIRSTQPSSVTSGRLRSRNATSARMSKARSSMTVARPRPPE